MAKQIRKLTNRKLKRKVPKGVVHIQATFNNTIITITNVAGEVVCWSSAGACVQPPPCHPALQTAPDRGDRPRAVRQFALCRPGQHHSDDCSMGPRWDPR